VPCCLPDVTATASDPPSPRLDLTCNALPDTHDVAAQSLPPNRETLLISDVPTPVPTIVTDIAPVPAMLMRTMLLISMRSYECSSVVVPDSRSIEIAILSV
jgi:hypothetical protein